MPNYTYNTKIYSITSGFIEELAKTFHGWNELISSQISFNFDVVSTPDEDLSKDDLTFQDFVGRILHSILEQAIAEGTMVAQDKKSGELLTTDEIYDDIEELEEDEHQSGTDDTEEPTDQ